MKYLFLIFTIISFLNAYNINLNLLNINNKDGKIKIGLFNNKNDFLQIDKSYKGKSLQIDSASICCQFKNIPNGRYAISVFHDENNNNKLDTNFMGIPKEGYGVSYNGISSFSSPKFEDANFVLDHNITLEIKLYY